MQLNLDRSIAEALQQLCQTKATLFRMANQNAKQVAEATLKTTEGVMAMTRGEEFLAYTCAKVILCNSHLKNLNPEFHCGHVLHTLSSQIYGNL